jgi:hypothetical protein
VTWPEAFLRRAAVAVICAVIIVAGIYLIAVLLNLIAPIPGPPPP